MVETRYILLAKRKGSLGLSVMFFLLCVLLAVMAVYVHSNVHHYGWAFVISLTYGFLTVGIISLILFIITLMPARRVIIFDTEKEELIIRQGMFRRKTILPIGNILQAEYIGADKDNIKNERNRNMFFGCLLGPLGVIISSLGKLKDPSFRNIDTVFLIAADNRMAVLNIKNASQAVTHINEMLYRYKNA